MTPASIRVLERRLRDWRHAAENRKPHANRVVRLAASVDDPCFATAGTVDHAGARGRRPA